MTAIGVTHRKVASTIISFNGTRYWLSVRKTMKGTGLIYFQQSHEAEIQTAKSLCFAEHISKFGYNNQLTPDNAMEIEEIEEEKTIEVDEQLSELDKMKLEILEANKY